MPGEISPALARAKQKLAENRASGPDDLKHKLTQAEIDAIMAENERRATVEDTTARRKFLDRAIEGQTTDSQN